MLCHLNETVQPIHLKYYSFMVQNHPLLQPCRSRPTSVLVQGARLLAGSHKWYPTVHAAHQCSCVWCTFLPLQTPFCPFLMLLIWETENENVHLSLSLHQDLPVTHTATSLSTGDFWRGIGFHLLAEMVFPPFHVLTYPPTDVSELKTHVYWENLTTRSRFCSFPCLSLPSL